MDYKTNPTSREKLHYLTVEIAYYHPKRKLTGTLKMFFTCIIMIKISKEQMLHI